MQGGEEPRRGSVDRAQARRVRQHELDTAQRLADLGDHITFLSDTPRRGQSADVDISGVQWELKSPTSSNPNTIRKRLGEGAGQSPNIVFDLTRTSISVAAAAHIARDVLRRYPDVSVIRMIGRDTPAGPLDMTIRR